jgi:hypothetical protein
MSAGLGERRERTMHLQNGHHVAVFATEAAEKGEHHLLIAELGKGGSHSLQLAAVIGDRHGVLAKIAKLRFQEKGT